MARIIYDDGSSRQVTNLGWLLRNAQYVTRFQVTEADPEGHNDCILTAVIDNLESRGKRVIFYATGFADRNVLKDFLDRPLFSMLPVLWFGEWFTIGNDVYESMRP